MENGDDLFSGTLTCSGSSAEQTNHRACSEYPQAWNILAGKKMDNVLARVHFVGPCLVNKILSVECPVLMDMLTRYRISTSSE